MAGMLLGWVAVPLARGADLEKGFRVAMSCSAYAMIRTAEFPETVKVYEDKKPAADALEASRARMGMIWTNRVFFSSSVGAQFYHQIAGRSPSNGEIDDAKGQWMKILNDASESEREAIHAICRTLYEEADTYCAKTRCVEFP
jgi:hypothetical protein